VIGGCGCAGFWAATAFAHSVEAANVARMLRGARMIPPNCDVGSTCQCPVGAKLSDTRPRSPLELTDRGAQVAEKLLRARLSNPRKTPIGPIRSVGTTSHGDTPSFGPVHPSR